MKKLFICLCFSFFGLAATYAQSETSVSTAVKSEVKIDDKKACSGQAAADGQKKACCASKSSAEAGKTTDASTVSNLDKKSCAGASKDGKACCADKKGKTASVEAQPEPVKIKEEKPIFSRTNQISAD